MIWRRRSKLTKREREVRDYLLQEHRRLITEAAKTEQLSGYEEGRVDEITAILGTVLDILGG